APLMSRRHFLPAVAELLLRHDLTHGAFMLGFL
ncbi:MAG: hypothetical protein RL210_340, partial [Pseudomonadota bacterium]